MIIFSLVLLSYNSARSIVKDRLVELNVNYEVSDDALYMTLHASINGKTTILDWNPGKPNWWITGWNPEFQDVAEENILLSGTINFSGHDDLWEAFYNKYNNIDDRLTFNPDIHTVNFVWK